MRFRVRDGAEAMIDAVRKFLKNDTNRILMQGDIANAYGSINRFVSAEGSEETHPLPGPAVCISVCERWNGCGEYRKEARTGRSESYTTV